MWAVTCLSNGDIAAGTSDGLVRVFTRSDDRVASAQALSVSSLFFDAYAISSELTRVLLQDYDVQVSKTQVNS